MSWRFDPKRYERARARLASTSLGERLESAGALVVMGRGSDIARAALVVEHVRHALHDESDLDACACVAANAVLDLPRALDARTRLELRAIGAAKLAGVALDDAQRETIDAIDAMWKPAVWRLVAHNDARAERLGWIAPEHRARFFWLSDGVGISPAAVDALPAVAELVARFPEAAIELEALVDVARRASAGGALVIRLGAWLARETRDEMRVAAAARGDARVIAHEDAVCDVSFEAPSTLVVDVLDEAADAPALVLASGREITGARSAETLDRFRFELDTSARDEAGATLVVKLSSGERRVRLFG